MSPGEGELLNPGAVVGPIDKDESFITDEQIVERYGDRPHGRVLPRPPHEDCPGVSDDEILRDVGLDPKKYALERVWEASGYRIKPVGEVRL